MKGCLPQFRAVVRLVPLLLQAVGLTHRSGREGWRLPKAAQGTPVAGGAAVGPAGMQRGEEGLPRALQGPAVCFPLFQT